jgi:hypothetical protein
MKLGCVAQGVIRTFRYLRGSHVAVNKFGLTEISCNPKGGICFFFELDYNKNVLIFTASITREDDSFVYREGRDRCVERAQEDQTKTFAIELDHDAPLLDQIYFKLTDDEATGALAHNPFLKTLLARMRMYGEMNSSAADFWNEMQSQQEQGLFD